MSRAVLEPLPAADSAVVLLVEDEPVLRSSMARSIGKLPNVEVMAAANYAEALALLDSRPPRVVVSDIDLPDGSGADLAGELSRRGVSSPLVIVSGRRDSRRAPLPRDAEVIMVEKPVGIRDLRHQVTQLLGRPEAESKPPFSVIDFVQLACLGGHSARIDVDAGEIVATVIVKGGELWSAKDRLGNGQAAFHRISFRTEGVVSLAPLAGDPGPRDIHVRWEIVMMDSARAFDEAARDAAPAGPAGKPIPLREAGAKPSPAAESRPQAPPADTAAEFERQWDLGVEALLRRDFARALRAFRCADSILPGIPRVVANLRRLGEMEVHEGEDTDL